MFVSKLARKFKTRRNKFTYVKNSVKFAKIVNYKCKIFIEQASKNSVD